LGVLQELGIPYTLQPGAGAFYGPNLEYVLRDRTGRDWQCGTIQFDVAMPARFQLAYVDASGTRRQPVMLHRAVYGSLERFLGILLEHHGATLPAWLAPVQVRVLPVGDDQAEAARDVRRRLADAGLRAELDAGASLGRRIAGAHNDGAPFVAVLGAREVAGGTVTLRAQGQQEIWAQPVAVAELRNRCQPPDFAA
jgi:threonyl-tRNA synthetase